MDQLAWNMRCSSILNCLYRAVLAATFLVAEKPGARSNFLSIAHTELNSFLPTAYFAALAARAGLDLSEECLLLREYCFDLYGFRFRIRTPRERAHRLKTRTLGTPSIGLFSDPRCGTYQRRFNKAARIGCRSDYTAEELCEIDYRSIQGLE